MPRSLVWLAACAVLSAGSIGSAQGTAEEEPAATPAPSRTPTEIDLPDDAKAQPPAEPFALYDGGVVRVLAELDKRRLVKLSTGQLEVVDRAETESTDKPFRAASVEEVTASLAEDGLKDHKIVSAGYYLFAYDCTEAYYLHTRSILESMLKGVVQQLGEWGLEPQRPETRLVVVIMPSRAAFDAYEKMPKGVAAYYNGVTNRVVLYEDDRLFDRAPEFALKQGSYVVAHEALHQLLHNTGIQQRLSGWPAWISEGIPEYFCPLRVNSQLTKVDGDQLPVRTVKWSEAGMVNDLRMHDLLRTRAEAGKLIKEVVSAPGLTAHGYSVAWGLVHFLAEKRPKELAAYLADIRQKGTLADGVKHRSRGPDPLFVKHFGDDFASIERQVQRHLTSKTMQTAYRDPYVNQTHYVLSVTVKKGRVYYTRATVKLSPDAARDWTAGQRRELRDRGLEGHIVTRECPDAKKAAFQLRKIMN